jgi:catechol 2,3-dioxygenase-like lactoylglutathione lyase family enzyme
MKMTVDFYVGVLGMRLVHAMKVPPGVGIGPGNRGNPPVEEILHYFFDMGRDGLLAFFEIPKKAPSPRATATRSARCSMSRSQSPP